MSHTSGGQKSGVSSQQSAVSSQQSGPERLTPDSRPLTPGPVAAIDYGDVRIGVALTDAERTMALPHATYERRSAAADAQWFRRLVQEYRVTLFVVGLPVHLDGRESQKSRTARQFAQWLTTETGVPCLFFDERFTTAEAEEDLRGRGFTARQRKARRDMLAAQILLRDFLAGGCQGHEAPGGLDD